MGFGLGLTRLVMAMKENAAKGRFTLPTRDCPDIYIAPMGDAAKIKAVGLAQELRAKGIFAECDIVGRSLKAQMKYADKTGAAFALVIGDNEIEAGVAQLKNLRDSDDKRDVAIDAEALANIIKK